MEDYLRDGFARLEKKIDNLQDQFVKLFSNGPITLMSNRIAKLEADISVAPVCPVIEHTQLLEHHSSEIEKLNGTIKDIKKLGWAIMIPLIALVIELAWKVVVHVTKW